VQNALAIVLGRAGSRGLPGKNTAPVAGKPCAQWTIEHAQAAAHTRRVLVSSDDDALLTLARTLGADTHERAPELASDTARIDDAARAAMRDAEPDHAGPIVILYANVPVRPADLTDRAVELLEAAECDSVQSYARAGKHHPWWTAKLARDGRVEPWSGDVLNHGVYRRQELPPAFVPDGGVIACSREALELRIPAAPPGPHAFFGRDRRGIETAEGEVIDIDTRTDLLVAEAVLKERARAHR
jgi:CMP-N,N'-diacetyllegionaminic acid synthase